MDKTNTTTMHRKREEMPRHPFPRCHQGTGDLDFTEVLGRKEIPEACHLGFIHDDILPPGVSIGLHRHEKDEEYYYIISGRGVMTLDDKQFEVKAGDITAIFPGGTHGLLNNGTEDLRIIVVGIF